MSGAAHRVIAAGAARGYSVRVRGADAVVWEEGEGQPAVQLHGVPGLSFSTARSCPSWSRSSETPLGGPAAVVGPGQSPIADPIRASRLRGAVSGRSVTQREVRLGTEGATRMNRTWSSRRDLLVDIVPGGTDAGCGV